MKLVPKKVAQHMLGDINRATIDRWRSKPGFPRARVQGGRVYFLESDLLEYIRSL